jgi:hypothetical protein
MWSAEVRTKMRGADAPATAAIPSQSEADSEATEWDDSEAPEWMRQYFADQARFEASGAQAVVSIRLRNGNGEWLPALQFNRQLDFVGARELGAPTCVVENVRYAALTYETSRAEQFIRAQSPATPKHWPPS